MPRSQFSTFEKWMQPRWRVAPWWPGETSQSMYCSLLHILSVAHALRIDPTPLVQHLADEHRGRSRSILRQFAERLAAGVPLISALEQTPDVLSESMILALRFGSQSGTLTVTYQQLLESHSTEATRVQTAVRGELVYWSFLLVAIVAVVTFLMSVVAPTYLKIAAEMGMSLPAPFRSLRSVFQYIAFFPLLWVFMALAVAWLIWSAHSRRLFGRAIAGPLLGAGGERRSAELLQLLAVAVEAGRPIPGSLSTLARYHFDRDLRQKLLYARNEVEQGSDVWKSLADAKILTPAQAHALANSPSASVRAWTLRRLAVWKQAAFYRKAAAALLLLRPVVVLLFAAIVLWIASAFFTVLTHMVLSLS